MVAERISDSQMMSSEQPDSVFGARNQMMAHCVPSETVASRNVVAGEMLGEYHDQKEDERDAEGKVRGVHEVEKVKEGIESGLHKSLLVGLKEDVNKDDEIERKPEAQAENSKLAIGAEWADQREFAEEEFGQIPER